MMGKLFIYPTDTVWGIGGDIFSKDSYERIASIKGHELKKPLSIVFKDYEMISELINLPIEISREWLEEFFTYESTIGFPKVWAKKKLPSWICQDSNYITVRCLNSEELDFAFKSIGGPLTSTSLNRTTKPPITTENEALDFHEKYASGESFCKQTSTICSGRSSTIVLIDTDRITIVREGKYINEIREHFKLLSTPLL